MEGPQFSTLAESNLYRQWGCDVIGMTNMPEAKLAREAEICYASVAMVTDFDCWHPDHGHVTVEQVIKVLVGNAQKAKTLVSELAPAIHHDASGASCECKSALEYALITSADARDPEMIKKLDAVAGRVLNT
jgi:5'-methylthioadenosine phosphorylase